MQTTSYLKAGLRAALFCSAAAALSACGGGGNESGPAESIVMSTESVTVGTPGNCVVGTGPTIHVYGGTPPYTLSNSVPQGMRLDKSTVTNSGDAFVITFTNGVCMTDMPITAEDRMGRLARVRITNGADMRDALLGLIALSACAAVPAAGLVQQGVAPTSCQAGQVQWLVGGAPPAVRERYCGGSAAVSPSTERQPVRISSAAQGLRDVERRRIIEGELQQEQALYRRLQQTPADAEAIGRSRANLAALNAELGRLPRSATAP